MSQADAVTGAIKQKATPKKGSIEAVMSRKLAKIRERQAANAEENRVLEKEAQRIRDFLGS